MPVPASRGRPLPRGILIRLGQLLLQFALFAVILFTAAGTTAWANGWAFVALSILLVLGNAAYVLPRNPEVIVEPGRRHQGTPAFDTVLMVGYTMCYLTLFVIAGLDAQRLRWAPLGSDAAVLGGLLLCIADIPVAGATAANRNLELLRSCRRTSRCHSVRRPQSSIACEII